MGSQMYYNPSDPKHLDINQMPIPRYVKNWLNYLLVEINLAPRTIFNYFVSVQTFLRWVKSLQTHTQPDQFQNLDVSDVSLSDISGFTRADIYSYLSFCASSLGNSATSRAAKLSALRSFYDYLKDKEPGSGIVLNPAKEIASPKHEKTLPKYLTLDEAKRLLSSVDGEAPSRDYCMLLWFLTCGMRLSELVAINIEDVKDSDLRLFGKGRKERVVHLNEPCMAALEDYLIERKGYHVPENESALFVSKRTCTRLSGRRVEQIVDGYLAKAGLQGNGYSTHKLRHSAATIMYQNSGGSIGLLEIKEILGHANISTTQVYTHISGVQLKNAMDTMGKLLVDDTEIKNSDGGIVP